MQTELSKAVAEVNRAARSLVNSVTKAAGGSLAADKMADIAMNCQQNAMQLWSISRSDATPPAPPPEGEDCEVDEAA